MGLGNLQDAANCECVMGACDGDNNFDMSKYNALQSQCLSPEHQANIESTVLAAMAAARSMQGGNDALREANDRIEICMKLAAFAKCRDEKTGPSAAEIEFAKKQTECAATGAIWDDGRCIKVPEFCPGGSRDANGVIHGFRTLDGQCVFCPGGTRRKSKEWLLNDVNFECIPPAGGGGDKPNTQTNNAPGAPEGMSLTTKLLIGGAVVAGLAVAAKYAMAPKSNPTGYKYKKSGAYDNDCPVCRTHNALLWEAGPYGGPERLRCRDGKGLYEETGGRIGDSMEMIEPCRSRR